MSRVSENPSVCPRRFGKSGWRTGAFLRSFPSLRRQDGTGTVRRQDLGTGGSRHSGGSRSAHEHVVALTIFSKYPRNSAKCSQCMVDLLDVTKSKVLKVILAKDELSNDVDFNVIANMTNCFAGSDIKNLCVTAAYRPVRELVKNDKEGDVRERKKGSNVEGSEIRTVSSTASHCELGGRNGPRRYISSVICLRIICICCSISRRCSSNCCCCSAICCVNCCWSSCDPSPHQLVAGEHLDQDQHMPLHLTRSQRDTACSRPRLGHLSVSCRHCHHQQPLAALVRSSTASKNIRILQRLK
ncbi:hypothetical protein PHJA_001033900 [Phtheirospermum japonicum]|uniref:AAA ATPase AAA+ lid domain-containing protein n=1 Tax=Phtheirospermum japonicum TaxID=374723 RepID=A0A830BSA2_9LAMI|nr:hypothetical protein PHJA_001033900 [Phtheirospermum japonicum]